MRCSAQEEPAAPCGGATPGTGAGMPMRCTPISRSAQLALPLEALCLRRIEPALNMARYYRLSVEPDLFGAWLLVREWGQIGSSRRVWHDVRETEAEAFAALGVMAAAKKHGGSRPAS